MKRHIVTVVAVTLAVAVSGCAQKSDVEAVQASQKEILAKLESMEKDQKEPLLVRDGHWHRPPGASVESS